LTSQRIQVTVESVSPDEGSLHASLDASLMFAHVTGNDSFQLLDQSVTRDTGGTLDVGAAVARATFSSAFVSLVAGGAVSATGLDPGSSRLARLMQGEGRSGQLPVERVKEYVFRVPRLINGIEVFETGVSVNVHRNGKVARVAAFGPTVISAVTDGGAEVPTEKGYFFTAKYSQGDADARVRTEYPKATVRPLGIQYWLPEGLPSAVVAPSYMYFVSHTSVIEGRTINGRGFYVSYSSAEANAAPTIWPKANPNATGDARP
jgi:hypothetical protein